MKYFDDINNLYKVSEMSIAEMKEFQSKQLNKMEILRNELQQVRLKFELEIIDLQCDINTMSMLLRTKQ